MKMVEFMINAVFDKLFWQFDFQWSCDMCVDTMWHCLKVAPVICQWLRSSPGGQSRIS